MRPRQLPQEETPTASGQGSTKSYLDDTCSDWRMRAPAAGSPRGPRQSAAAAGRRLSHLWALSLLSLMAMSSLSTSAAQTTTTCNGWRYIRARNLNPDPGCVFQYSIRFYTSDPKVLFPVVNGPNACNVGAKGVEITNEGCARPVDFVVEGSNSLNGPYTLLAAAIEQSWNTDPVKLLELLDPEEEDLGLSMKANTVIYPQKLEAGIVSFGLEIPFTVFVQQRAGLYGVTYSSTLEDGTPLPSWMKFDSQTITLAATYTTLEGWSNLNNVTNSDGEWTGDMTVLVTATDPIGGTVSLVIPFSVNWRVPPAVFSPLPDVSLEWGSQEEFVLDSGSFVPMQPGVTLTYDAFLLKNGAQQGLPPWMAWNPETLSLVVLPTLNDVGTYTIQVSATPEIEELKELVAYDTFNIVVDEFCEDGYRFFKVSTYTHKGFDALACSAEQKGFLSYWQYNASMPDSPADELIVVSGSYVLQRDDTPLPSILFGHESQCVYAKAVRIQLAAGCGHVFDLTVQGTNSPFREQGWKVLTRVQDSGALAFGPGQKFGDKLEFQPDSFLVPELPSRVLVEEGASATVCPAGYFSSFRLVPFTRITSNEVLDYHIQVRGESGWTTPFIEGQCYDPAGLIIELTANSTKPGAFTFQGSAVEKPDSYLYSTGSDWETISIQFGSTQMTAYGTILGFVWSPYKRSFRMSPFDALVPPAGTAPTVGATIATQRVVAGQPNYRLALPDSLFVSNNAGLYGFLVSVEGVGGKIPSWLKWNDTAGELTAAFVKATDVDFSECPAPLVDPDDPLYCTSFAVSVTGTDPHGSTVSTTIQYELAQAAPSVVAPIIAQVAVINKMYSKVIEYIFQRNIFEGTLSFSAATTFYHTGHQVAGLPPFLKFMSTGGVRRLEGTPSYTDIGEYEITLTAQDAYGWMGTYAFVLRVEDSCLTGYRYITIQSLNSPSELYGCATADLANFMKAKLGASRTPLQLQQPAASPTTGVRYGKGTECLNPTEFVLQNCSGLVDFSITGSPNPSGGGPWMPLVEALSSAPIDTTQAFLSGSLPRLETEAVCPEGTYTSFRLRLPGDQAATGLLYQLLVLSVDGVTLPVTAIQSSYACFDPARITLQLAEGSVAPSEFYLDGYTGAAGSTGTWVELTHDVDMVWNSLVQAVVIDQGAVDWLPEPVTASFASGTSEAKSGIAWEWYLPAGSFLTNKTGVYELVYQASLPDGSAIPPWLVFDGAKERLYTPFAASFDGTDSDNTLHVVLRGMNAHGDSASVSLFLTVAPGIPTQISPLANITIDNWDFLDVDLSPSFQVNVKNDSLTFQAEGLPAWASVDPVAGRLTGLPGLEGSATVSSITVSAFDSSGDSTSVTLQLTVLEGCYEGFQYLRVMGFVASTDNTLRACITNWDVASAGGLPYLTYFGGEGTEEKVEVEPTSYAGQLGSIFNMGTKCVVPNSFRLGFCQGVSTVRIDGLPRGADPSSPNSGWVKLVEWKSTTGASVGGTYELVKPLTVILAPTLLVAQLSSSNADPSSAKVGDELSLSLVASRTIYQPEVSIGGQAAEVFAVGSDPGAFTSVAWTADRPVLAGEPEEQLQIQVQLQDLFGNVVTVKSVTNGSLEVLIDSTQPVASVYAQDDVPLPGGAFGPLSVSRLYVIAAFSEPVANFDPALFTSSNGNFTPAVQLDAQTWRAQLVGMVEGAVEINVGAGAASDSAGNPSIAAAPWTAVYDVTPPLISMTYNPAPDFTFDLTAEDGTSGVSQLLCRVYSDATLAAAAANPLLLPPYAACQTPFEMGGSGINLGTDAVFDFSAIDSSGNTAEAWSYSFRYDATTVPVQQPFGPTPPPTPAPTTAAPTPAPPTQAPTPQPTTPSPTPAPTPGPTAAPTPEPTVSYSVPGGQPAEGDTAFQVSLLLAGLDISLFDLFAQNQVVEAVGLMTDVAPERVGILQKFAVSSTSRTRRRSLQQTEGESTSLLVVVEGWADDAAAEAGAILLAQRIVTGYLQSELYKRGVETTGITYSSVLLSTLSAPPAPAVQPSDDGGAQAESADDSDDSLLSDPVVLGAVVAAAVVVVIALVVLMVMIRKKSAYESNTVAPMKPSA